MVATLRGTPGHDIVEKALKPSVTWSTAVLWARTPVLETVLESLLRFLISSSLKSSILTYRPKGSYAVGWLSCRWMTNYVPLKAGIEAIAQEEDLDILGWREVPHRPEVVGDLAREAMPAFEQLFVSSSRLGTRGQPLSGIELDRPSLPPPQKSRAGAQLILSLVVVPDPCLQGNGHDTQLEPFFPDLSDGRFQSTLALVHSRYSTNTFPSWPLAQPFRLIAHNGEINTIRANRNWMRARQSQMHSDALGDLTPLFPIVSEGGSDSASFDETVELLTLAGRSCLTPS